MPWRQIEADLRKRIAAEEWPHGGKLPSIRELAEHYSVSHGTVAKALRELAKDGLIETEPHFGIFRV